MIRQIYIDDPVDSFLADHGGVLLVHPREEDLMLKTFLKIKDTDYPLVLSGHVIKEEDQQYILEVFEPYLDRFLAVIWNNKSRLGHRSDVRYYNLEKSFELFRISVTFLDSDLPSVRWWKEKNGILKRHTPDGDETIELLKYIISHGMRNELFAVSIKHNDNKLHRGKWNHTAPILSGVWCFMLEVMRDFRTAYPDFNPFLPAMESNLKVAEDIVASWFLSQMKRIGRFENASWDGDRDSYNEITISKLEDWAVAAALTDPDNFFRKAMQKRFNGGPLNDLRHNVHGIRFENGVADPTTVKAAIYNTIASSNKFAMAVKGVMDAD